VIERPAMTTKPQSKTSRSKTVPSAVLPPEQVHKWLDDLFTDDLHAKRVLSLSHGVVGVLHAAAAGIHAIGQGLAAAMGTQPKHAIKQVDRLLSNAGVDPDGLSGRWVAFVLAERKEAVVVIDWTDFAADDQTTCAINLVTTHGRATPLVWKTVLKGELLGRQHLIEDELIERLQEVVPREVKLTLLADRGFGDWRRYDHLESMGWDWVIRFREDILVTDTQGVCKSARQWLSPTGRAKMLKGAQVTAERAEAGAVVVVHDKRMKEPWCLATSRTDLPAQDVVKLYGRRFTIEENFRDSKDLRFGLGLSATHIGDCGRRDRLLLLVAMAEGLLTLLGAACEETGLDRKLKANTVKRRTHSLFRQGSYWFQCIPTMREEWLRPLMEAFGRILLSHAVFSGIFGVL
jgi:DDE family transposase